MEKWVYHKFDISGRREDVAKRAKMFEDVCDMKPYLILLYSVGGIRLVKDSKIKHLLKPEEADTAYGTDIRGHRWDDYNNMGQPRFQIYRAIYMTDIPGLTIPGLVSDLDEIKLLEEDHGYTMGMIGGGRRTEHMPYFSRGMIKVHYEPAGMSPGTRGILLVSPAIIKPGLWRKLSMRGHRDSVDDIYPCYSIGYSYSDERDKNDDMPPYRADELEAYAIIFSREEPFKDKFEMELKSSRYAEFIDKMPRVILQEKEKG